MVWKCLEHLYAHKFTIYQDYLWCTIASEYLATQTFKIDPYTQFQLVSYSSEKVFFPSLSLCRVFLPSITLLLSFICHSIDGYGLMVGFLCNWISTTSLYGSLEMYYLVSHRCFFSFRSQFSSIKTHSDATVHQNNVSWC